MIDFLKIIKNPKKGRKSHIIGECPFCGKDGHFYINTKKAVEKDSEGFYRGCFDCKRCKVAGNVIKLLSHLDLLHLLDGEIILVDKLKKLVRADEESKTEKDIEAGVCRLPVGWKRVYSNDYLTNERGWDESDFINYKVGETKILNKFENYVIFPLEEDNEVRGFFGRAKKSKEEIDQINKRYKEQGLKKTLPRYRNSESDFAKLLYGYDELTFGVKTAILVEGLFDKRKVDRVLGLKYDHEMKCLGTQGNKVTPEQIMKLVKKGVEQVIMIYDPDSIRLMKQYAFVLRDYFSVQLGATSEKDLDESSEEEVIEVFENLKSPMEFFNGVVEKKKLV